jgi:hypothetical protein
MDGNEANRRVKAIISTWLHCGMCSVLNTVNARFTSVVNENLGCQIARSKK